MSEGSCWRWRASICFGSEWIWIWLSLSPGWRQGVRKFTRAGSPPSLSQEMTSRLLDFECVGGCFSTCDRDALDWAACWFSRSLAGRPSAAAAMLAAQGLDCSTFKCRVRDRAGASGERFRVTWSKYRSGVVYFTLSNPSSRHLSSSIHCVSFPTRTPNPMS